MKTSHTIGAFLIALAGVCPIEAAVVTIPATADTTLLETTPTNSLGSTTLAVGVTEEGFASRGLIRFDLARAILADAQIMEATLTIYATRAPHKGGAPALLQAHKSLVSWQEGSGTGNTGIPAQPGDATWAARAHTLSPWGQPGGQPGVDYASLASTSIPMNALGAIILPSTLSFTNVVQSWLDTPASNHGLFLITENEATTGTARRIASTEDFSQGLSPVPAQPPTLTITYEIIPEPSLWLLTMMGLAVLVYLPRRRAT